MNEAKPPVGTKLTSVVSRSIAAEHVERISGRAAIVTLIIVGVVLYEIQAILLPFVAAGVVAYAATPLVEWLKRRTGLHRTLAAVIVFLLLASAVAAMAHFGIPPLIRAMIRLVTDLEGTIERAAREVIGSGTVKFLGQPTDAVEISTKAVDFIRNWLSQSDRIGTLATVSAAVFFGSILTTVMLCYFLIGGPRIAQGLFWLIPPKQRPFVEYLWSKLDPALKRYFIGLAIVVAYSTIAAYIGLGLVLGIRHAAFLAVLTGILEIVPFVGPISAAVIAGLVSLKDATGIWSILAYAAYATVLRVSIDQFIAPIVLGRAGRVHPTLVIFCFASGGILFGFAGVILAVPVALSIKIVLETVYDGPPAGSHSRTAGHAN